MKKLVTTLGLLIMSMGMSSTALADVRIIDNPEKLVAETLQPKGAIQTLDGTQVVASSDLTALIYEYAHANNHLALVREADRSPERYATRLLARNPVLVGQINAVKVADLVAVAKTDGIWLPSDDQMVQASAAATMPSALPTVRLTEAMATKAMVDSLQTQLSTLQDELAALKAKPESSLTDDDRQKRAALPGQIKTVQTHMAAAATSAQKAAASATSASGSATTANTAADTATKKATAAEESANRANSAATAAQTTLASLSGVWWWIGGLVGAVVLLFAGFGLLWWNKASKKSVEPYNGRLSSVEYGVRKTKDSIDNLYVQTESPNVTVQPMHLPQRFEDYEAGTISTFVAVDDEKYCIGIVSLGNGIFTLEDPSIVSDYTPGTPFAEPQRFIRKAVKRGVFKATTIL